MGEKMYIRGADLRIWGYIETDSEGNQIARDFYHRIVGRYDKKLDVTKDFYYRTVARGNVVSSLIPPIDQQ